MSDVEAMRWHRADHRTEQSAEQIVAWVEAHGGEARYLAADTQDGSRIAIRHRNGWAHCSPGQWVVKGKWCWDAPHPDGGTKIVREFTVADSRPGVSS